MLLSLLSEVSAVYGEGSGGDRDLSKAVVVVVSPWWMGCGGVWCGLVGRLVWCGVVWCVVCSGVWCGMVGWWGGVW